LRGLSGENLEKMENKKEMRNWFEQFDSSLVIAGLVA
jgi:hypothetical protein